MLAPELAAVVNAIVESALLPALNDYLRDGGFMTLPLPDGMALIDATVSYHEGESAGYVLVAAEVSYAPPSREKRHLRAE